MIRALPAIVALALLTVPAAAQQIIPLDSVPLETQPLQGQTAQPQPYQAPVAAPSLRAQHGNWEIRCVTQTDCVMTQLHRRSEQTADAVFTIVKPRGLTGDDGQAVEAFAEIVVPLGVYLPGGLGLKVDQGEARAAPFERCIEEGCVVRAPISAKMLQQLKEGGTAYLVVFGGPEKPVQIPISLNGFTAAYNAF